MTTGRINQVTTVDEGATVAGARLDFVLPRPEPLFLCGLDLPRRAHSEASVAETLERSGRDAPARRDAPPGPSRVCKSAALAFPDLPGSGATSFFFSLREAGSCRERRQLPSAPPLSRPLCVGGQARGRAVTAGSTRASCTPAGRPDLVSLSPTRAMKSGDGCTAQTATHADPS